MTGTMSYGSRIEQQISKVYLKGISTKILQHMARVRNVSDQSQARRWVMELLQNAQDVSYEDQDVRVRIRMTEKQVVFSHNGRPFRVKDILSIINQVSSKNPGDDSVGKFGTGFVTTFQLSEKVEIVSVLQEEGMPRKDFRVLLDRSGNDDREILDAIEKATNQLRQVDEKEALDDFDKNDYNTHFIYSFLAPESEETALTGMEDLRHSVAYILLFSKHLSEIVLEYDLPRKKERITFRRGEDHPWKAEEEGGLTPIRCMDFVTERQVEGAPMERMVASLLYYSEKEVTLAAGWQEENGLLAFSEKLPRLFVNFPLVGAEEFCFPVVINCMKLLVNEARNGITLVDNVASKDAENNKKYMTCAVENYGVFLREIVKKERRGLENILRIPAWKRNAEMSEKWVKANIYGALYRSISSIPMIETAKGVCPLNHDRFILVREEDEEIRQKTKALLGKIQNVIVPLDNRNWYEALQHYPVEENKVWSLKYLLYYAEQILPHIEKGEKLLEEEAMEWLRELCALGLSVPEMSERIRTGEVRLLPNQSDWREGRLHAFSELKRDSGIPEMLKDVAEKLDILQGQDGMQLRIRDKLLHESFSELFVHSMEAYEKSRLDQYISIKTDRGYPVKQFINHKAAYEAAWQDAWLLLISCGREKEMYDLCRIFYHGNMREYAPVDAGWREEMWRNAHKGIVGQILDKIVKCGEWDCFVQQYFGTEEEAVSWMNRFLKWAAKYNSSRILLPNQRGNFCPHRLLSQDGTPDDALKEITAAFVERDEKCDFYQQLVDRRMETGYFMNESQGEKDIAYVLDHTLHNILSEGNLGNQPLHYQMACSDLLSWMEEHPEKTRQYFPSFCAEEAKASLLTPKAVVGLQKKAKEWENFLEECGMDDIEEMKEIIRRQKRGQDRSGLSQLQQESGVFFGDELDVYPAAEWETLIRKIGVEGERFAIKYMVDYLAGQGAVVSDKSAEEHTVMVKDDRTEFHIVYGDAGNFHQPGWDIRLDIREKETNREEAFYIEVKTHTLKSIKRKILFLSKEQMKKACEQQEHYIVMEVLYDFGARRGVECISYVNPVKLLAEGTWKSLMQYYEFAVVKG